MEIIDEFFGASRIPFSQVSDLKNQTGDLIVYAVPVMAVFTLVEMFYTWRTNSKNYNSRESLGSLFVGLGNVAINLLLKLGIIYVIVYMYNLVPWRMSLEWWTILPCLLLYDLCSFFAHWVSHISRFFWATHVVHHSAEHFNLTVSFRLSWVQHIKILFLLPAVLAGFHPVIFFAVTQIAVLAQFWQHTEHIKKLHPIIEKTIITPSNHRVHHGSDEKYLDKNFGAIFAFWDKLFGTYQKEEETPTYGLTSKIEQSMNPLYLNFHEFKEIASDLKRATGFREKFFMLFAGPGKVAAYKDKKKLEYQRKKASVAAI